MVCIVAVGYFVGANDLTIDGPNKRCRTPIKSIRMKLGLGRVHEWLCAAIVISSNPFSKVIGLNLASWASEVVSRPLPVDLILGIRHQDCAADNPGPICCFHDNLDSTKEDIEACPYVWCIAPLIESKFGTISAEIHGGIVGKCPTFGKHRRLCEIDKVVTLCKACIWGACC